MDTHTWGQTPFPQRDGFMHTGDNSGGNPNYYLNSFGGPEPQPAAAEPGFDISGEAMRNPYFLM